MDVIEMSGKTSSEAVEKALKILDATADEVTVTILEPGSKGFLGIGQKAAKVMVKLNYNPVRTAKNFLRDITSAMNLSVAVDAELDDRNLVIDLKGSNMGVLIGKHGYTLDSLQYLTNLVVNKNAENYVNVLIDTENYRKKRKETLESLARNLAKKVRQTRKSVRLEPMSPSERRVIHSALQSEKYVTTYSEGVEPFRNVVVAPKKEGYSPNKPYGGGYNKYSNKPYKSNEDKFKKYESLGDETSDGDYDE